MQVYPIAPGLHKPRTKPLARLSERPQHGEGGLQGGQQRQPFRERFLLTGSQQRRAEAAGGQDFRRHVPRVAALPQCLIKMVFTLRRVACRGRGRPADPFTSRMAKLT